MSHITCMDESWHTHQRVIPQIPSEVEGGAAYKDKSWHTYERVMSNTSTCLDESNHIYHLKLRKGKPVNTNASWNTYERVMSHASPSLNESFRILQFEVAGGAARENKYVMSYI